MIDVGSHILVNGVYIPKDIWYDVEMLELFAGFMKCLMVDEHLFYKGSHN